MTPRQQLSRIPQQRSGHLARRRSRCGWSGRRRHLVVNTSLITTVLIETQTSPGICALSPGNEIFRELTSLLVILDHYVMHEFTKIHQ